MKAVILSLCTPLTISFVQRRIIVRNSRNIGQFATIDLEKTHFSSNILSKIKPQLQQRRNNTPIQLDKFILDIPQIEDDTLSEMTESLQSLDPVGRAFIKNIESTAKSIQNYSSKECLLTDSDCEYDSALEDAKMADSKYGLCSPESEVAWSRVDEIYMANDQTLTGKNNSDDEALEDIIKACQILNQALDKYNSSTKY